MSAIKPHGGNYQLTFPFKSRIFANNNRMNTRISISADGRRKLAVKAAGGDSGEKKTERQSFLSLEEAGLVEVSGLSSHERFLCRLTISSLNLLKVISEQEGCAIEELNAGKICDWFLKDKLKREQDLESAVLQWDDSEFML